MLTFSQVKECIVDLDRDGLESLIDDYGEDIVEAGLLCDIEPCNIAEAYSGEYRSDEDFAEETALGIGAIDSDTSWPNYCIDWTGAARDLMMDYSEENGYYFRCF